ncbi:MAG: endonuclease domain-containing protein [Anaerolineales bacterium]|nr:endonuclease domain-containing protein [Anaerolineales bacterium]
MDRPHVITNQKISPSMKQRAKELRGNMTPEEQILWKELRTNKLNGWHFRRQQIIGNFIVDFYCHAARLIVEVDGEIHRQQLEKDAQRDAYLSEQGFDVMRIENGEVHTNLKIVLSKILAKCEASRQD